MRLTGLVLLLVSLAGKAYAQSFTPHSIVFDGAPQYEQKEMLAVSGLAANKPLTQAELDAVTQRLGDTGLFAGISFSTSGTTLKFALEPTPKSEMRKVVFTNFVLFTPEELKQKLAARVPLFHGEVPVTGSFQEAVQHGLEALLKERGVEATVSSIGGPGGTLDFSIATPPVVVSSLAIAGVDFDGTPALAKIRDRVLNTDYVEGTSGDTLRSTLVDAYLDLGYVDAAITPIGRGEATVSADKIGVPLTGTAAPGALYHVAKLVLPQPVPGVPESEIAAASQLKVGGPAARIELLSTRARLVNAFANRGYLDARATFDATKDEAAHTMAYVFQTVPGVPYHMRNLQTNNMNTQQAQNAQAGWKIPPGAVFERVKLLEYLKQGTGAGLCGGRPASGTVVPDRAEHLVDVIIGCEAK
jgi:outer membrane protein assembly factor BamA